MKAQLAFLFMMVLNAFAFMSQQAMVDVAREENVISPDTYTIGDLFTRINQGVGNDYSINISGGDGLLPTSSPSIGENLQAFLFPLQVFLNWIAGFPVLIISFFSAVPYFINGLGLPSAMSFAIGAIWYIVSVVTVILTFIK